jgi:hypothetical protein
LALLVAVVVIGLATVGDYGITIDEFVFDVYGPKALAWYGSGFTDRAWFDSLDERPYGPWFQVLVAAAQSLNLAERFEVRHAMTFVLGIGGLAAVLPIARLTIGRWAGFAAIVLCLITGNFYGHLFFSPNDVPFMAAMTWATLAVIVMARGPSWEATFCAGLLTGLAIATRPGGLLAQIYLLGAMLLCALEVVVRQGRDGAGQLVRIAARTGVAVLVAWMVAIALWPWLQVANPVSQFTFAFAHFADIGLEFGIHQWGRGLTTVALPWHYVPGELLARLPEAFIVLLAVAVAAGSVALIGFLIACAKDIGDNGRAGVLSALSALARHRAVLVLAVATVAPLAFVMIRRPIIFDGIRHLLFIIPLLAIFAAWGLLRLAPLIRRVPHAAAILAGAYVAATVVTMAMLHPLEYVATNAFAGGTAWSAGRFDLDYWTAAATEALRRLEQRLQYDAPERFAGRVPSVHICIPWRELLVAPMFRRPWNLEPDPQKADYVIETERSHCAPHAESVLIDEVKRFDRPFAWAFENRTLVTPQPRP